MVQAVVTRQVEDVIAEERLVEGRVLVRILGEKRAPDPLSGRRQDVGRVTAAGGEDREDGALGIGEDRLAAALRVALGFEHDLGPVLERGPLRGIDIANGDEGQPRRLPLFPGGTGRWNRPPTGRPSRSATA